MSKATVVLLLVAHAFSIVVEGQIIPNSSFENWIFNGSWEDPQGWGTPNGTTFIMGFSTVTKSNTVVVGNYSVKLATRSQANLVVPGVIATGSVDVFASVFKGGFALTDSFKFLTGFYRYITDTSISDLDSALILSYLWRWNAALGKRDTVAKAYFLAPYAGTFKPFTISYQYNASVKPDSGIIVIASTKNLKQPKPSGTLWIDHLEFSNHVGIAHPQHAVKVFVLPNPVSTMLQIVVPHVEAIPSFCLYTVNGQQIAGFTHVRNSLLLPVLHEGIYFYKMQLASGDVVAGKLFIKHPD
ncbi:MAG: T9SS type A sorting domain-containing protein [Chitinophagales bacterium]|nr:T9SS type A sorting domain-containing protein [Chitinophagales bacterium]MDW8428470.1 T9SS type A sorting domain-containing protein [Chitinophagales bacterium]